MYMYVYLHYIHVRLHAHVYSHAFTCAWMCRHAYVHAYFMYMHMSMHTCIARDTHMYMIFNFILPPALFCDSTNTIKEHHRNQMLYQSRKLFYSNWIFFLLPPPLPAHSPVFIYPDLCLYLCLHRPALTQGLSNQLMEWNDNWQDLCFTVVHRRLRPQKGRQKRNVENKSPKYPKYLKARNSCYLTNCGIQRCVFDSSNHIDFHKNFLEFIC